MLFQWLRGVVRGSRPRRAEYRPCRECGAAIRFERRGDRWAPVNEDGTRHRDVGGKGRGRRKGGPPAQPAPGA